jgi:hypothetical protein
MAYIVKLEESKVLLEEYLGDNVQELFFEPKLARIQIILRDQIIIYVQYNNHDQYSYNLIFSEKELDRCRFDNFDKNWDVITAPNHFHPRNYIDGFDSPMNGNPKDDIPLFCEMILNGVLFDKEYRPKSESQEFIVKSDTDEE